MEKVIEELKGVTIAVVLAGILLAFIFGDAGALAAEVARKFAQSIGGT